MKDENLFVRICSGERNYINLFTEAMEIPNAGCIVRTTSKYKGEISISTVFVPDVKIERKYETSRGQKNYVGMHLVSTKRKDGVYPC